MLQAVTAAKIYELSFQTEKANADINTFIENIHTTLYCVLLQYLRGTSLCLSQIRHLQKFGAEAIYRKFVFPRELRLLHYNCRYCQNNDTFCQQLALNSMKFVMCHVQRIAVIWSLLKMPSFRDSNAKMCAVSSAPHRLLTVHLVGLLSPVP